MLLSSIRDKLLAPQSRTRLILASKSPRRVEILRKAGFTFEVRAAGIDELLGREVNPGEIISCFEALVQERYQVQLSDMTIGAEIERQARSYEQERYAPLVAAPAGQRAASGEG